jgi:hypothetical protein
MTGHLASVSSWFRSPALALILTAGLGCTPLAARAASPGAAPARPWAEQPIRGVSGLVLASDWWQKLYDPLEKFLSTRAGMIQFGTVIMILALVVIWWRRC